jgi:hypothetical protein
VSDELGRIAEVVDVAPRPQRWGRWVVIAALVVVIGAAATWAQGVDARAGERETMALTACRDQVHDATISADLLLDQVAFTLRPTLRSASGLHRLAVVAVMTNPARRLVPDVTTADRVCHAVSVLPWHRAHRARREAVTAYASALAAKVRAIAADGAAYFDDDPSLRRLRRAADIGVVGGRY